MTRAVVRRLPATALAFALLVLALAPTAASASDGRNDRRDEQSFQHVFVIMMENTSYSTLIGNANAPWINQAARTYGLATNYTGVTHPSQPNYIAVTSGSTNGVVNDNDITIDVPNIVDQLESHHLSWKGYNQSYFAGGNTNKLAHSAGNQLYERKHNPFVSYLDVQSNPSRMARVVDLSELSADLSRRNVPNYSFIAPDQCNDMHGRGGGGPTDPCDFSNENNLIATGDAFLRDTVAMIMSSSTWKRSDSVIYVSWDETEFPFADTSGCCDAVPGGGHVVTLVITRSNDPRTSAVAYNHYSLLSTVQRNWGFGCLAFTCDRANVKPMRDLTGQND